MNQSEGMEGAARPFKRPRLGIQAKNDDEDSLGQELGQTETM